MTNLYKYVFFTTIQCSILIEDGGAYCKKCSLYGLAFKQKKRTRRRNGLSVLHSLLAAAVAVVVVCLFVCLFACLLSTYPGGTESLSLYLSLSVSQNKSASE